jgi:TetR/AcrR family transcriptional regulator, regulator of cefoperazone and chloramphenicol sensitivity
MSQLSEDLTRTRLIEAAGEVFAEHGYQAATVREICTRAGANVAAVNYHFRDKMGLYVAVLENSLCASPPADVRALLERSATPEDALRQMIYRMLQRMYGKRERGAWHVRIMAHELARPTAALDRVVAEVIQPSYTAMREIIGRILGLPPDDETTRLSALSVISQVVHYAHAQPVIVRVWPQFELTQERLDQIAAHITNFSLCSLRAMARQKKATTE